MSYLAATPYLKIQSLIEKDLPRVRRSSKDFTYVYTQTIFVASCHG